MKKKMMILGASALQVPAIKKAKELGYQIILVDYDPEAAGFSLADVKLVVSTLDQEEVYRQALLYEPDFILTSTSDGPVRTAAYVNEKMGKRPDLSYEDSLCATIKSYMRDRLKEYKVPIPSYFAVETEEEFLKAVSALGGEGIVKPADNAGSRGVIRLRQETRERLKEIYQYSKSYSRNGVVMVEEYMEGSEVSVESMTVEGETTVIAITDKIVTPPPFFVEIGHLEPSRQPLEMQEEIVKVTKQAVKAIRLQNGPSHTEVKITEEGPKIVEVAARLGGDFITSRLVPLSTGVDMVGASVLLATGEKADLKKQWDRGSAIRFIQGRQGVLKEQNIPKDIYKMAGIEEVVFYKNVGDRVESTRSSNDRLGHIIATGKTAEEAMERANKALESITIVVEEES